MNVHEQAMATIGATAPVAVTPPPSTTNASFTDQLKNVGSEVLASPVKHWTSVTVGLAGAGALAYATKHKTLAGWAFGLAVADMLVNSLLWKFEMGFGGAGPYIRW